MTDSTTTPAQVAAAGLRAARERWLDRTLEQMSPQARADVEQVAGLIAAGDEAGARDAARSMAQRHKLVRWEALAFGEAACRLAERLKEAAAHDADADTEQAAYRHEQHTGA